jgi:uncharacterized protein (DUF2345 family)
VFLDGKGNVQVSSKASIRLACGGDDKKPATAFIELKSDGTLVISAKSLVQVISEGEGLIVNGEGKTTALSGTALSVSGTGDVEVSAKKKLNLSSQTATDVSSTGKTSVQGAIVTLN